MKEATESAEGETAMKEAYADFIRRLTLFAKKHPRLITTVLSNIFTMRLIGNKTHGDLAEIAIVEFIDQYMDDFQSTHVGKDLYRAKSKEEDIHVKNEISNVTFPISMKAYGNGPLQLSTDKDFLMYPLLEAYGDMIESKKDIVGIFNSEEFHYFSEGNVLPFIYDEKKQRCNILVFNSELAEKSTAYIKKTVAGGGRKHPVYRFYDTNDHYICEVRYGNAMANALQRGLWTNTRNALPFFNSVTNGWVDYAHNMDLVTLFSQALVAGVSGHRKALAKVQADICRLQQDHDINV